MPPALGWAAIANDVPMQAWILVLIIFVWTPPHFWALALYRDGDYAKAGIPMLPVVAGQHETRRQILFYSILLAPVGASPWLFGYAGLLYGITALIGGALMVAFSWRLYRRPDEQAAKHLFAFSILYLFLLFVVLLVEQGIGGWPVLG